MISIEPLLEIGKKVRAEQARKSLLDFTKVTMPEFQATDYHVAYYRVLDAFARGLIKKLIISMPPQHGKSEGSSRRLPAYLLGRNPNLKIAIGSYSSSLAKDFNRDVQKIIDEELYREIYPDARISGQHVVTISTSYQRNSDVVEIVNKRGSLRVVGRGGPLTGRPVDVMIMDDLYKDFMEANSPVTREMAWKWYTTVVSSRLHNDSQQLMVFTRWHEDDIIGRLEKQEKVVTITSLSELNSIPSDVWVKVNYEAIKETEPTELDPREVGEPLWPQKHSLENLKGKRKLDAVQFECLYQGNPTPKEGLLYDEFETYTELPETYGNGNYTDTADSGDDFLCSISYRKGRDKIYITDIVYTQEDMGKTELLVPLMFTRSDTRYSRIESNAGGRYFALKVKEKLGGKIRVTWFHQSKNKEARIITNAATVSQVIVFPIDWETRWPEFARHVNTYKKLFKANKFHDAADTLTGIVEFEIFGKKGQLKRRN